jgi:predicted nuclease of predicted toxin-antitoxin system
MSLQLYMDVHVPSAITDALSRRGVDVITAQEDSATILDDDALLDRATAIGRVLFSMDTDLRREAVLRQRSGKNFSGVIAADQMGITIGQCIADLELIATVYDPEDIANRLEYLPL